MKDESQLHFLKRVVKSSATKIDIYDFDETIKEKVLDIKNNGSSFDYGKWNSYYEMRQRDIYDAMLKNPYTPDDIIEKIVEKTIIPQKILDLLKSRALPDKTIEIILSNPDNWRVIRHEAFNFFAKNEELDMCQQNINAIAKIAFAKHGNPMEDSRYCILAFVKDEKMIETMAKSEHLNEYALQYMVQNIYISEDLKNKLYDGIGFNYNDIECPADILAKNITPHIAETIYEVAIDTIDGVISGKIDKPNGCTKEVLRLEAETVLEGLATHNSFTEATQIDYLHRFKSMSDKKASEETVKAILIHTEYPSVLEFAYYNLNKNMQMECFKNRNSSYRILVDAKNKYVKQIQKAIESEKGSVPSIVEQKLTYIARKTSVTPQEIEAIMMWFGDNSCVVSAVCDYQANAKDVFEKINERLKNSDKSTYTKLATKTRIVMDGEYFNITDLMLKFLKISSYARPSQMKCKMEIIDCQYAKAIASKPELKEKYEKLLNSLRNDFELTNYEKEVLSSMEIIFQVNEERCKKDKYFDPEINSAYYLNNKLIEIGNSIIKCQSMYDIYCNIDKWQEEYEKAEDALYQKEEYREWKQIINDKEI